MARSVSIYENKEFATAWSELQFAKDYNKKVNRDSFAPKSTTTGQGILVILKLSYEQLLLP
jgi:hypothetical protein